MRKFPSRAANSVACPYMNSPRETWCLKSKRKGFVILCRAPVLELHKPSEGHTMQRRSLVRTAYASAAAILLALQSVAAGSQPELPPDILALFKRLDALGVPSV